jgi:hypothetical protein
MEEIVEIMGEHSSLMAESLSTRYCWEFADGKLYITIETGNESVIQFHMVSNIDPYNPNQTEEAEQ